MADENRPIRDLIAATDKAIERRREIVKAAAEEQQEERRRFPPPWRVHLLIGCFVVKDSDDQPLAYVYFQDDAGNELLPYDEAQRIAGHISRLPELLRKP